MQEAVSLATVAKHLKFNPVAGFNLEIENHPLPNGIPLILEGRKQSEKIVFSFYPANTRCDLSSLPKLLFVAKF
jgi:hypothetical protein